MPIQLTESIPVIQNQDKPVLKEIHNILICTEGKVYWDVWTWDLINDQRNKVIKKEYYSMPIESIVDVDQAGKFNVTDIEGTLWGKISTIDAMPESTDQQKKAKKPFKNIFSFTTG